MHDIVGHKLNPSMYRTYKDNMRLPGLNINTKADGFFFMCTSIHTLSTSPHIHKTCNSKHNKINT